MKILVVDFAASEGGALTILREFYEEAKVDKNNSYVFLLSGEYLKPAKNIEIVVDEKEKDRFKRLKFDLLSGHKYIKRFNPDLVFSLQNTIVRGAKCRQVVYVHQALPFQSKKNFSFFKKQERKYAVIQHALGSLIKKSIKRADGVIVQTKWMREAICKKVGKDRRKIFVIAPKVDVQKKAKNINTKTFFCLTSDYIYKNNDVLYDAVKKILEDGVKDFEVNLTLDGKGSKNLKYLGKISREDVLNKMAASVLVFPSYMESFGLPLLEAREIGTIVLASDTDFAHEILDGYDNAYFFNPFSSRELADLMEDCIEGKIALKKVVSNQRETQGLGIIDILERVKK